MKKTVKSEKKLFKWFLKHDWKRCSNGDWTDSDGGESFNYEMFKYCGDEIDVDETSGYFDYVMSDYIWYWLKGWFVKDKDENIG